MWEIACLSQESRVSFESGPAMRGHIFKAASEAAKLALLHLGQPPKMKYIDVRSTLLPTNHHLIK
jgi:hypothetical protein